MPRRRLFLALACLLVAPLLLGAYYPSCSKTTVGFYPNYAFRAATDPTAIARATSSQIKGTVLFVPWNDGAYNCPTGGCTVSNCAGGACTINTTALSSYVKPFLDKWVHKNQLSLNIEVVFTLHSAGFNNPAVGPTHIQPLGVSHPTTRAEFKKFYDAVYDILKSPDYNDSSTGAIWLISIGNEVNLYLGNNQSAWDAYTSFYNEMYSYVKNTTIHPGMFWTTVGVSTTWFGGVWKLRGPNNEPLDEPDYVMAPRVVELNQSSDAFIYTYYPVDAGDSYRALNPDRAAYDIFWMDFIAWFHEKQVVMQEVGYPTDNALHGSTNPRYSTYTNGEQAQQVFVNNLFDAVETPQYDPDFTVVAASWWSLFDFAGPTTPFSECFYFASIFGQQWNVPFKRYICTLGLVRADNTNKPAWANFESAALSAPNW